jgi:hypothetical protein
MMTKKHLEALYKAIRNNTLTTLTMANHPQTPVINLEGFVDDYYPVPSLSGTWLKSTENKENPLAERLGGIFLP